MQYAKNLENFHISASMKTKQVVFDAFWKYGWIIFKPGVQVSIGHFIIENKIWSLEDQKSHKNAKMGILGDRGDTYAIVGRPSNLV